MNNIIDYELGENTTYQDLYKIHTGHRLNGYTDDSDASSDSSISSYSYLKPPPYSYHEISQNLVVVEALSEDESNENWQTITYKGLGTKTRNLQTFKTRKKSNSEMRHTIQTTQKAQNAKEEFKYTITPMEMIAQKLSLLITEEKCLICQLDGKKHYRRECHYKSVITWLDTQLKKHMLSSDITLIFCKICNLPLTGNEKAIKHYETVSHMKKIKSFCVPCLRVIDEQGMTIHCNSKTHLEHIDATYSDQIQSNNETVQVQLLSDEIKRDISANFKSLATDGLEQFKTGNLQTFETKAIPYPKIKQTITPKKKNAKKEFKYAMTPMETLAQKLSLLITNEKCLICQADGNKHYRREVHYKSVITWLETELKKMMLPADITLIFCKICNLPLTGNEEAKEHYETAFHREKMKSFCVPCLRVIEEQGMKTHCNSQKHLEHINVTYSNQLQLSNGIVRGPSNETKINVNSNLKSWASVCLEPSKTRNLQTLETKAKSYSEIKETVTPKEKNKKEEFKHAVTPMEILAQKLSLLITNEKCLICQVDGNKHYRQYCHYKSVNTWLETQLKKIMLPADITLIFCKICNLPLTGNEEAKKHYETAFHREKMKSFCVPCLRVIEEHCMTSHRNSKIHLKHIDVTYCNQLQSTNETLQVPFNETKINVSASSKSWASVVGNRVSINSSAAVKSKFEEFKKNEEPERQKVGTVTIVQNTCGWPEEKFFKSISPLAVLLVKRMASKYCYLCDEPAHESQQDHYRKKQHYQVLTQWIEKHGKHYGYNLSNIYLVMCLACHNIFSSFLCAQEHYKSSEHEKVSKYFCNECMTHENSKHKTHKKEPIVPAAFQKEINTNHDKIIDTFGVPKKIVLDDSNPLAALLRERMSSKYCHLCDVPVRKQRHFRRKMHYQALAQWITKHGSIFGYDLDNIYLVMCFACHSIFSNLLCAQEHYNSKEHEKISKYYCDECMVHEHSEHETHKRELIIIPTAFQEAINTKQDKIIDNTKENNTVIKQQLTKLDNCITHSPVPNKDKIEARLNTNYSIKENTKEHLTNWRELTKVNTEKCLMQNSGIQVASDKKDVRDKEIKNHTGLTTVYSHASAQENVTSSNYTDVQKDTAQNLLTLSLNDTKINQSKPQKSKGKNSYSNVTLLKLGLELNRASVAQEEIQNKEHVEQCQNIFKKFNQLTKKLESVPLEVCSNFLDRCNRDIDEIYSNNIILDKKVDDTKVINDDAKNYQNDCSEKTNMLDIHESHLNLKQEIDKLNSALTAIFRPTFSYFDFNKISYLVMYVRNFTDSLQSEQRLFRIENVFQHSTKNYPEPVDFFKYDMQNDMFHYDMCKMFLKSGIKNLENVLLSKGKLNLNLKYLSEFSTKLNSMYNNDDEKRMRKTLTDEFSEDRVQTLENHKLVKFSRNVTNTGFSNSGNNLTSSENHKLNKLISTSTNDTNTGYSNSENNLNSLKNHKLVKLSTNDKNTGYINSDNNLTSLENHKLDKLSTNDTNTGTKYKTESSDFENADECFCDDRAHTSKKEDLQEASCTLI